MTTPPDTGQAQEAGLRFSETNAKVAAAFVAAQQEFGDVVKDRRVEVATTKGRYSYTYADLGTALDAVMPALHKHRLAVLQPASTTPEGAIAVATTLLHESGEWVAADPPLVMRPTNTDPQSAGSALTYARRYALLAFCGLAAEDDDGRHASRPSERPEPSRGSQAQPRRQNATTGTERAENGASSAYATVARGIAALGLETDAEVAAAISEATGGEVVTAKFTDLSPSEATVVARYLIAEFKARQVAATNCDGLAGCGARKGEPHLFNDVGEPCLNDRSEAAKDARLKIAARERGDVDGMADLPM